MAPRTRRRILLALGVVLVAAIGVIAWRVLARRTKVEPRVVEIVALGQVLGALELERSVTVPIEIAVSGASSVARVSSVTSQDRSVVRALLSPKADEASARMEILERLRSAALPERVSPALAPAGGGVTLTYALVPAPTTDPIALRTLQDWDVERALLTVSGVAAVSACGGRAKRIEVVIDPARLRAFGIAPTAVVDAIAGAPRLRMDDLAVLVVASKNGAPVKVADVAAVTVGSASPDCGAFRDGKELIVGEVVLRPGADAAAIAAIVARLQALSARWPGARLEPLETDARAHWIHARVASPGDATDALVAAARASGDVTDVLTRRRDDEMEILAHVRTGAAIGDAARAMARAIEKVPGARYDITSPAAPLARELRVVRARLQGEDLEALRGAADAAVGVLADVPGVHGVAAPDARRSPRATVVPDRSALARFGVSLGSFAELVEVALGGRVAGTLYEGERRFDVVVRLPRIGDAKDLADLTIATPSGASVPLTSCAQVKLEDEPARITRDGGRRALDVLFDAPDPRVLEAARARLATTLKLPVGVELTFTRAGEE